jgi:sortase A
MLVAVIGGAMLGYGIWIPAKAALAQVLLERAWQQTAASGAPVRAWPWADAVPVARLHLPDETLIVLSGGSGEALAFAPSHVAGSAEPGGFGTTMIAGHRDTHFVALRSLGPDTPLVLERPDGLRIRYLVEEAMVLPAGQAWLASGEVPMLALVTCWPFDGIGGESDERFVVLARAEGLTNTHDIATHDLSAGQI